MQLITSLHLHWLYQAEADGITSRRLVVLLQCNIATSPKYRYIPEHLDTPSTLEEATSRLIARLPASTREYDSFARNFTPDCSHVHSAQRVPVKVVEDSLIHDRRQCRSDSAGQSERIE